MTCVEFTSFISVLAIIINVSYAIWIIHLSVISIVNCDFWFEIWLNHVWYILSDIVLDSVVFSNNWSSTCTFILSVNRLNRPLGITILSCFSDTCTASLIKWCADFLSVANSWSCHDFNFNKCATSSCWLSITAGMIRFLISFLTYTFLWLDTSSKNGMLYWFW